MHLSMTRLLHMDKLRAVQSRGRGAQEKYVFHCSSAQKVLDLHRAIA